MDDLELTTKMQCFPLYSILAAIGVFHVDFFSLDVEGAELPILRTIPFDKVDIDSFVIETKTFDQKLTVAKRQNVKSMLMNYGYNNAFDTKLDTFVY